MTKIFTEQQHTYQQRVDHFLAGIFKRLPNHPSMLIDAMHYGVLLGGKRLRPFLVYTTGEMLGVPLKCLDSVAASIECIHAYSLIHDDLPAMDNDELRRGQPTCHIRFGEAMAILAGDALQTLAFTLLSDADYCTITDHQTQINLVKELAHASGDKGMCFGQSLDFLAEGKHLSLAELEQIHINKTGALILCAVRLGRLAAKNQPPALIEYLDQYAHAIGLAFQVQDDILDVIGSADITGKTVGTDEKAHKNTYPSLLGLEKAKEKAKELCFSALNALEALSKLGYNTDPLKELAYFIIQRDK